MQYTLKDHDSTKSIVGRWISNLHFSDDIYLIACSSNELQKLTDSLAKITFRYGMEINHEKSEILFNDLNPNKDNSNNLIINIYGKK